MKKVFLLLGLAIAVLSFVACGPKGELDGVLDTTTYDGSEVTVEFWHNAGAANQAMFTQFATEFKTIYPNITINQVAKSGTYGDLQKQVSTSIAAGQYPTMAYCYPDHVASYLKSGRVQDLNELINSKSKEIAISKDSQEDILQGAWDESHSYAGGYARSWAFSKSTEALFYDIKYFEDNGLTMPAQPTWDQIWQLAADIKRIDAAKTTGGKGIPFCYDSSDNLFITASQQLNIPYTNTDGDILFNNTQAKSMVNYFKAKYEQHLFITADVISSSAYGSDYSKLPETGRNPDYNIRMYVGSTGGARYSQFASGYNSGVAAVPYFGNKLDGTPNTNQDAKDQMLQGPSIVIFKKANLQETVAAWLFTKFITNTINSARYSKLSGYAPIRHSSFEVQIPVETLEGGSIVGLPITWAFNANKSEIVGTVDTSVASKVLTLDSWSPTGQDKALADAIRIFKTSGDNMFSSAVFKNSSTARESVGAIIVLVLQGENIDNAFDAAYEDVSF
jgi:multiple sugar transport system substrate-binding protein